MTAQSFTEGDWIYGVRPDGSIWISIGNRTTGPHYQWDWFATVADARLATAAPDLLDALLSARNWHSRHPARLSDDENNYRAWEADLDKIDAAIAKARGEVK